VRAYDIQTWGWGGDRDWAWGCGWCCGWSRIFVVSVDSDALGFMLRAWLITRAFRVSAVLAFALYAVFALLLSLLLSDNSDGGGSGGSVDGGGGGRGRGSGSGGSG
jgi:hypothetical protein